MKRATKLFLVILALLAVAAAGFIAWRFYDVTQKEALHKAIHQAWKQTCDENTPAYLEYIDLYSDFGITHIEKGDPWVITVTVWGVDLAGELKKTDLLACPPDIEEWELNEYLISLAKQADTTEVTTILYAWPEDEGYRIRFSDTFVDAMSGMVYSYVQELADEMMGGAQS